MNMRRCRRARSQHHHQIGLPSDGCHHLPVHFFHSIPCCRSLPDTVRPSGYGHKLATFTGRTEQDEDRRSMVCGWFYRSGCCSETDATLFLGLATLCPGSSAFSSRDDQRLLPNDWAAALSAFCTVSKVDCSGMAVIRHRQQQFARDHGFADTTWHQSFMKPEVLFMWRAGAADR